MDNNYYDLYQKYYSEELSSLINELEDLRKTDFQKFIKFAILFFLISVIAIFILHLILKSTFFTVIFIIADIFLFKFLKQKFNKAFTTKIKKEKIRNLIKNFGEIEWYGKSSYSKYLDNLNKSGLFPDFGEVNIDDEFYGTYNGVDFVCSEVKLIEVAKTNRSDSVRGTVFKGVILKFKTNKYTKDKVIISSKNSFVQKEDGLRNLTDVFAAAALIFVILFISAGLAILNIYLGVGFVVLGVVLCIIALKNNMKHVEKVVLEDPKFMEKYKLYSTDQVEARYLITTAFMERFYNLKTAFGAKEVKCSFVEEYLIIAISSEIDLFEIGDLFKSFNDKQCIKQFFEQLQAIHNMIDYFKLDEKTGL